MSSADHAPDDPARSGTPPLALVCATNEAYAHAAAAMFHSVLSALTARSPLALYVIADEVAPATRTRLERVVARASTQATLVWIEPDVRVLAPWRSTAWARAILLRLCIGSLLPDGVGRVLYLDTDVIARADVSRLWSECLDGYTIAAVQNHLPSTIGEAHRGVDLRRMANPDPHTPYFNSGVLLIDLDRWRRERVEERALQYALEHADELPYPDQDALNVALQGAWKPLALEWNVLTTLFWVSTWPESPFKRVMQEQEWRLMHGPGLVHYIGGVKPWMPGCTHPLRDLFSRQLRGSGWWT